ncbi:hypothetical protein QCA50_008864 [Cerrena zonata]|uniref:Glutamate-5-semialdehyde dehydrogenase n=1 Tax=Cerrena zonata TaxID=2478898 RepID=A0AAW0G8E9_9APHY
MYLLGHYLRRITQRHVTPPKHLFFTRKSSPRSGRQSPKPSSQPMFNSLPHPLHLTSFTHVHPSTPESYTTEHLSFTLSVLTVPSLPAAISHINSHSSHHTDCIVTENENHASVFCRGVDSAGTFVNASTRFADGFRFGFGTEVGISTGRIHARGPVGLEGLVIYKYMLKSTDKKGHIVAEFGVGEGKKKYKHTPIEAKTVPF